MVMEVLIVQSLLYNGTIKLKHFHSGKKYSTEFHFWYIYFICCLLFYVAFNSQGHIATGSLQVEKTSAYCTVNHRASARNYLVYLQASLQDNRKMKNKLYQLASEALHITCFIVKSYINPSIKISVITLIFIMLFMWHLPCI